MVMAWTSAGGRVEKHVDFSLGLTGLGERLEVMGKAEEIFSDNSLVFN